MFSEYSPTIFTSTEYGKDTNGKVVAKTILEKMDRFELRKLGDGSYPYGDIIESCYHLDTVAEHGVCHTFNKSPYNWGFCSGSCEFEYDMDEYRQGRLFTTKEKTTMEIFDDVPEGAQMPPRSNYLNQCLLRVIILQNSFMCCSNNILHSSFTDYYKCAKPVLPEALTYVFVWDDNRQTVTYTGEIIQNEKWDNDEIGYTAPFIGDSGSPYMIHEPDYEGEERYTFVAVHYFTKTFYGNAETAVGTYMRGPNQCRTLASKLTPDVLNWIKQAATSFD